MIDLVDTSIFLAAMMAHILFPLLANQLDYLDPGGRATEKVVVRTFIRFQGHPSGDSES